MSNSNKKTHGKTRSTDNTIIVPISALLPDLGITYLFPADVGLAVKTENGGTDNTSQEYLSRMFTISSPISSVGDENTILGYIDTVSRTALIAAQAQLNLQAAVGHPAGKKKGKSPAQRSIDSISDLATQAWIDASNGITSPDLVKIKKRIQAERLKVCRLFGSNSVSCGSILISIESTPRMTLGNIQIVSGNTYCSVSGDFKIAVNASSGSSSESGRTEVDKSNIH